MPQGECIRKKKTNTLHFSQTCPAVIKFLETLPLTCRKAFCTPGDSSSNVKRVKK